jgi:hypothetical protein
LFWHFKYQNNKQQRRKFILYGVGNWDEFIIIVPTTSIKDMSVEISSECEDDGMFARHTNRGRS